MAFSLLPREDAYFTIFSQMTEKIQKAANALVEMMHGNQSEFEASSKPEGSRSVCTAARSPPAAAPAGSPAR